MKANPHSGRPTRPQVGIYTRVSTDEQAQEGFSLGTQEALCRRRCDQEFGKGGYDAVVYSDPGYSGALGIRQFGAKPSARREGLGDLVGAIIAGEVDTVVSWRLDRLLRNAGLWHRLLEEVLAPHNVSIILLDQQLDTTTPIGCFSAAVMAANAALHRQMIGHNIRDAHHRAMEQGYYMGYPPFGWERTPKAERRPGEHSTIRHNEEQGIWVQRMAEWYLAGWRTSSIVRKLNEERVPCRRGGVNWGASQVLDVLKSPLHAGLLKVDGELREGEHAPRRYYPPETYYAILEALERRKTRHPSTEGRPKYLLTGLLTCATCGRRLQAESTRHAGRYYKCPRTHGGDGPQCQGFTVRCDLVEKRTVAALKRFHTDPQFQALIEDQARQLVDDEAQTGAKELAQLRQQLSRVRQKMERWDEELSAGTMSRERWLRYNERLEEEHQAVQRRIEDIERADKTRALRAARFAELKQALASFDECWDGLIDDERRELIHTLVESLSLSQEPDGQTLHLKLVAGPEVALAVPFGKCRAAGDLDPVQEMTLRQMVVLWHLHNGLSRKEIGQKMGVKTGTVNVYISDLKARFQRDDIHEIISMALPHIEECLDCLPLEGRSRRKPAEAPVDLKPKDEKLLSQLAEGRSYTDIAAERQVVVSTVHRHARRVYGVIGVRDRGQAEEWWKQREAAEAV